MLSDILDILDKLSIESYVVTVEVKKAYDSLDHGFLLVVLTFSIVTTYILRTQMTQHFLKLSKSISELFKTFKLFSKFCGLKSNILKREVANIGLLKGVKKAA